MNSTTTQRLANPAPYAPPAEPGRERRGGAGRGGLPGRGGAWPALVGRLRAEAGRWSDAAGCDRDGEKEALPGGYLSITSLPGTLGKTQHPGPTVNPFPQALSARFRHRYVGSESGESPGGTGRTPWAGWTGEGGGPGSCGRSPRRAARLPGPCLERWRRLGVSGRIAFLLQLLSFLAVVSPPRPVTVC